ncbi:50S ribosomal protein L29 [candidate division WWE3 bacterium RIFOXYC2_FULL_42_13]|uniref:Large ribosomal subunit protein uL29 n=2 Tax=Katanobacteria TaxID=422282 RepID=A0A0G1GPY8_UNCKA|nr:MAG: 50S ribosomal protein L29 [candidate division WWE3 bacterium GW2011_GWB2_43_22]OGC58465.1 MAG: 50S ribosomal protein L29 [candidate division WWE3 bacterium RIFOXYA2_FULL_43_12]OGC65498.1 MAG: 50S ribosomal protein L29 [candidate division WWE3 bacterium RIFOXYA12_FULL_43_11]OGC71970.1 MAG: 50S ribosomal protein L29 [candidate division WWE3 bacterium RIFOXYB2_FULL_43_9]OGC73373.1 MAG: 50S ribosomal protein L29 [candidate division WWE3 bacterium RIFOXYC2_FULL_42_13]OGC75654.1 MAG: 50S rib
MNAKELRQKSEQELSDTKKNLEKEIREVSLNTLQGKEKNVKKAGLLRRDVAKILTVINEKKILSSEKVGE